MHPGQAGYPDALALLGFRPDSPVSVEELTVAPKRARIGDKVVVEARIRNGTADTELVLVDLWLHFVKAMVNGAAKASAWFGVE